MADTVRKASTFEILNHWLMTISCFLLILTGFGFIFHWEWLNGLFGSYHGVKNVHNIGGIIFTISVLLTMFNYLKESLDLGADDVDWLKVGGGYLSKDPSIQVPKMGKLNTGQKLFYLAVLLSGVALAITGFIIWLLPGTGALYLACHLIHNIAFIVFLVAIPAHVYLGVVANPGAIQIMITGMVPKTMARKKYPKWMDELEGKKS